MTVNQSQVLAALKRVKGPDLQSNIIDLGLVSEILVRNDKVYFSITVPAEQAEELEPLRQAAEKVVREISGVAGVTAVLTAELRDNKGRPSKPATPARIDGPRVAQARASGHAHDHGPGGHHHHHDAPNRPSTPPARPAPPPRAAKQGSGAGVAIPGVKHLIAVASGKGGVGKSTTATNLALGLLANGLKVGLLDADIYGPSQPRLLGISGRPSLAHGKTLKPMEGFGLKVMSMGFLVDEATPIIWRGPMVVSALNQMLRDVAWGELDAIIIDMPPGTGDVQLSMAQQAPLSGAIIVSTPQDLALLDARKGLAMFRKVDVPVLGIIENMSFFICPKCSERHEIFGHGGAEREAEQLGLPFLGGVPLDMEIRERSDTGQPIVATHPESPHTAIYREIARRVWAEVENGTEVRADPPYLEVSKAGDSLHVSFDDGRTYTLPAEMLRVMSPSAEVQGHSPEQRVTVGGKRAVKITELRPIGNYAVRIVFDDRHDTGLFTWTYLGELGKEKDERWATYLAELKSKGLSRER